MGEPAEEIGVSFREFWEYEGLPETRYELFSGEIVAMNQPSLRHGALQGSLIGELMRTLEGRCQVLGPVGVYCEATGDAFGPDVIVLCEPAIYDKEIGRALTNPSAIFEILSPGTSKIDTHEKLPAYKAIPSLREYVLVSQRKRLIQLHRRTSSGWISEQYSSGALRICDGEITVEAIYERVDTSALLPR
ncbi:MAG: Uma2 family endonuclease [Labilithrix sp.]|nr:Uma2 family endonuclease [Labilithrix sp.]MCW5814115.1 Uma2 family endonuclease [Labilithrix sp.]